MNLGTGFYLLFIVGLLLVTSAGLIWIINANFRTGQRIREVLWERIKLLRLGRMLKKRGISPETYLHGAALHDIEAGIRNCESCKKINECDNALEAATRDDKDLSFCPNDIALKKYSRIRS